MPIPLTARDYDIGPITSGDSRTLRAYLKIKPTPDADEEPYPALGIEATFTIKRNASDPGFIAKKTLANGGITVDGDPLDGVLLIHLTESDTAALVGVYLYELEIFVILEGDRATIAHGRVTFEQGLS